MLTFPQEIYENPKDGTVVPVSAVKTREGREHAYMLGYNYDDLTHYVSLTKAMIHNDVIDWDRVYEAPFVCISARSGLKLTGSFSISEKEKAVFRSQQYSLGVDSAEDIDNIAHKDFLAPRMNDYYAGRIFESAWSGRNGWELFVKGDSIVTKRDYKTADSLSPGVVFVGWHEDLSRNEGLEKYITLAGHNGDVSHVVMVGKTSCMYNSDKVFVDSIMAPGVPL